MIAASTALLLLGGSILLFLNPVYVGFEQARTGVPALTGYTTLQLNTLSGQILGDLVLWQGGFDETVDGVAVLKRDEVQHMLDVRGVFAGLFALAAASAIVVVVAFRRARDPEARAAAWRSVAAGARGLAIGVAVMGVFAVLAFDAAFEVFHELFFPPGSYTFDPRTDKLVQLFPEAFWSETTIVVGVVIVVAAVGTWWIARRRAVT